MPYLTLTALHVIAVVCWFSGLLYLGRLLVYDAEAQKKPVEEQRILHTQYMVMMKRLYRYITSPAAAVTVSLGLILAIQSGAFSQGWLHLKLTFVMFLVAYHFYTGYLIKKSTLSVWPLTEKQLRLYNEIPSVLLIAIVLMAYLKQMVPPMCMAGVFGTILVVLLGLLWTWRKKTS